MAIQLENFGYSFSHAVVLVDDRQFVGVRSVSINQELTESAIYGTDIRPLGRSVGQLQLGRGSLVFSDYEEGMAFFSHLGNQPFLRLWTLDYAQIREDGATRSISCASCRLTSMGVEHEAGPDALSIAFPFSFLAAKVNGVDLATTVKGVAQDVLSAAQGAASLFNF